MYMDLLGAGLVGLLFVLITLSVLVWMVLRHRVIMKYGREEVIWRRCPYCGGEIPPIE